MRQITELLKRVNSGDSDALNAVVPLVYDELKKLAAGRLRGELRPGSIETTALVHEAFLKLAGSRHPDYENRAHFFAIAARVMRQVLVDLARARSAQKRDGKEEALTDLAEIGAQPDRRLIEIDDALERLARTDPQKTRLMEMRYFGQMTAEDSATVLGISVHTVRRELRLAQAWLRRELAE
jgi:RNA polymerase sigma factor (TIGR02999 family)